MYFIKSSIKLVFFTSKSILCNKLLLVMMWLYALYPIIGKVQITLKKFGSIVGVTIYKPRYELLWQNFTFDNKFNLREVWLLIDMTHSCIEIQHPFWNLLRQHRTTIITLCNKNTRKNITHWYWYNIINYHNSSSRELAHSTIYLTNNPHKYLKFTFDLNKQLHLFSEIHVI